MICLIKADFLRLKYSKHYIYTLIGVGVIFLFYCFIGDATFFFSGNKHILGDGVGFISNIYSDKHNIVFGEILRNIMFTNAFIWILILIFSSSFFLNEYSQSTIKLSISYGFNRFQIFLSKVIIISIWSLILYYLLSILVFVHNVMVLNFQISMVDIGNFLKITIINFLILEVFIILTITLSIILKNTMIVNFIMSFIMISLPLVYMMVWKNLNNESIFLKLFIKLNPMYYLSTISAYNFENNIFINSIIYIFTSIPILMNISNIILKQNEF